MIGCIGVVANTDGGEGLARMTNESEIQETRVEDVMHYGLITCGTHDPAPAGDGAYPGRGAAYSRDLHD